MESDDGFDILILPLIGIALGLSFASMANFSPFMFAILAWIALFFGLWRGISVITFSMYGFTMGAIVGAMANIVPYSLVVLGWETIFLTMMIKPGQQIKPTTWIMTPLILMVAGGLAYSPYPLDFQNAVGTINGTINGYANNWVGCVSSCLVSPVTTIITLFTASFFGKLITGDIVGFFGSLFASGGAGIFGFLSVIAGVILTFIGLGIGGGASIFGSGVTFNVNEQGTRMAQSMGIVLLAYGLVILSFGSWFNILGGGWFGLDTVLPIVFAGVTFYGGYLQGKSIT